MQKGAVIDRAFRTNKLDVTDQRVSKPRIGRQAFAVS
jgi:hypothetical protein